MYRVGQCQRGLDSLVVPQVDAQRRSRRKESIANLIEKQKALKDNPTVLAKLYAATTESSKRFARIIGQADEAAVDAYLHSDLVVDGTTRSATENGGNDTNKCNGKRESKQDDRFYVQSRSRIAVPARGNRRVQSARRMAVQASIHTLTTRSLSDRAFPQRLANTNNSSSNNNNVGSIKKG